MDFLSLFSPTNKYFLNKYFLRTWKELYDPERERERTKCPWRIFSRKRVKRGDEKVYSYRQRSFQWKSTGEIGKIVCICYAGRYYGNLLPSARSCQAWLTRDHLANIIDFSDYQANTIELSYSAAFRLRTF